MVYVSSPMIDRGTREDGYLPFVSVIVIGKNEERNLRACFRSILAMDYPSDRLELIYIDSGSSDGSVKIARGFGAKIFEERSAFPTPGLARNRGIKESRHDRLHFVDGDMTIDKGYLKQAIGYLGKNNVACVIGRVLERTRGKNIFSKMLDYEWMKKKAGYIDAPGAGGTFLKGALLEVGGYNPLILKGQETELGFRIRESGYLIYMLDSVMGIHDYDITNLLGWVKRCYIMGKSYGKILTLPPKQSYSELTFHARSLLIQGPILLALFLLVLINGKLLYLLGILAVVVAYVIIRYWDEYYCRRDWHVLAYYLLMQVSKPIALAGMLCFFWKHFIYDKFRSILCEIE